MSVEPEVTEAVVEAEATPITGREAAIAAMSEVASAKANPVATPEKEAVETPEAPEAEAPAPEEDNRPTLDPVMKHVAERSGLDDEAIETLLSLGEDKATKILGTFKGGLDAISRALTHIAEEKAKTPATPATKEPARKTDDDLEDMLDDLADGGSTGTAAELRKELAEIKALLTQRDAPPSPTQAETTAVLDEFFDSLGVGYADRYGSGKISEMVDGSAAVVARNALAAQAEQIYNGAQLAGRPMTGKDALMAALSLQNPDRALYAQRNEVAKKLQARAASVTHRSASRKNTDTTLTDKQQAVVAMKAVLAKQDAT